MSTILLRRYRLGKTSCNAIANFSEHDVEVVRNDLMTRGNSAADILIRWGCSSDYPRNSGCVTVNQSEAMHITNNKLDFRLLLRKNNISIPETFAYNETIPTSIFPAVVRPTYHSQGRKLDLVNNMGELRNCKVVRKNPNRYYVSNFIKKDREVRVYCMSGRVVAMAEKKTNNPNAIAWNRATGNSIFYNMRWETWHMPSAIEGLKAFNLSGLDFGGVDVMIKGNDVYVLEINAAPSLTSSYRQTCFSRGFDYLVKYCKDNHKVPNFPFPERTKNYRDIIHPYLLENRAGEPATT